MRSISVISVDLTASICLKKNNYLLDADKDLPEKSRVGFIVVGLPNYVQSRISRSGVTTIRQLTIELNQLESSRLTYKKSVERKTGVAWEQSRSGKDEKGMSTGKFQRKFEPCRFCKKAGRDGMMPPERIC
jgi:hypothetical protein